MSSEAREQRLREEGSLPKSQCDPLVTKCLQVMGMSHFDMYFRNVSFSHFIRVPLDAEHFGDDFIGRYSELIDRIARLCERAFAMSDVFKPPGVVKSDEAQRKSHSVRPRRPEWVPVVHASTYRLDKPKQKTHPVRPEYSTWTPVTRTSAYGLDKPERQSHSLRPSADNQEFFAEEEDQKAVQGLEQSFP